LAIQSPTSQNWPDELISDYAEQERTTNQSIYENTAAGEAIYVARSFGESFGAFERSHRAWPISDYNNMRRF